MRQERSKARRIVWRRSGVPPHRRRRLEDSCESRPTQAGRSPPAPSVEGGPGRRRIRARRCGENWHSLKSATGTKIYARDQASFPRRACSRTAVKGGSRHPQSALPTAANNRPIPSRLLCTRRVPSSAPGVCPTAVRPLAAWRCPSSMQSRKTCVAAGIAVRR